MFMILRYQIAAEVAAPLSQCKKIVMVSNGKCDLGASKITGEILEIVANLPKSVEALTGIDISKVRIYSTYTQYAMKRKLREILDQQSLWS